MKRKAEEEVKFLQASGKITKTPSNAGLGARKKTTGSRNGSAAARPDQRSESVTPRSEEQEAAAGAVGGVSPSLNDFLQVISRLLSQLVFDGPVIYRSPPLNTFMVIFRLFNFRFYTLYYPFGEIHGRWCSQIVFSFVVRLVYCSQEVLTRTEIP